MTMPYLYSNFESPLHMGLHISLQMFTISASCMDVFCAAETTLPTVHCTVNTAGNVSTHSSLHGAGNPTHYTFQALLHPAHYTFLFPTQCTENIPSCPATASLLSKVSVRFSRQRQ
ncbi:hypothetical protein GDO81_008466 [Engystomops pustulosus]|uniref:Uncharacterized protein n=1 Tax=Engystomops pustulosus TaxID=76066 RepID=A0AAV7CFK0_ENGPU|nr:hypothetical protein GDO81_008466 [Engystomops pustulosus]